MAKLTISLEISPSDLLTLFALLRQRDEMRGPFTNLEDLFNDLRQTPDQTPDRETGEGRPEEGDTGIKEGLHWLHTDFMVLKKDQPEEEPEGREPQG